MKGYSLNSGPHIFLSLFTSKQLEPALELVRGSNHNSEREGKLDNRQNIKQQTTNMDQIHITTR